MIRVARFLLHYARHPSPAITREEVTLDVGEQTLAAFLFRPAGGGPHPAWVVLHGITVPGRHHPALLRFARALAGSGAAVLVPEIPSWQRLEVDPVAADAVIEASARMLTAHPAASGGVGLVGFSFGATQALVTASRPELRDVLHRVVGFGGYCDLGRTTRFMMVGEHEWRGQHYQEAPDPYGRWILAGNYLTRVPGYEHMEGLAAAARELAAEAGRDGAYAGDPVYDPSKARLRRRLRPDERELWDVLAPATGARPPRDRALALADALADAALAVHPQLDPRPALARLSTRVVLAHGRADLLVPFTETLRLREHIGPDAKLSATITRLFAHSRGADPLRPHQYPLETYRYLALLARALKR